MRGLSIDKSAYINTEYGKVTDKYKIVREVLIKICQIGRGISGVVYQAYERAN